MDVFTPSHQAKIAAAKHAVQLISEEQWIGVGSGSTVQCFLEELAKAYHQGLRFVVATASYSSEMLVKKLKMPSIPPSEIVQLDLLIDGADAIDPLGNMIKGGGGALLREKILAYSTKKYMILIDETKLTGPLNRIPLPVEISSFAYQSTLLRLEKKGFFAKLRMLSDTQPCISDNGNYLVDLLPERPARSPQEEELLLKQIPGVLETGLFYSLPKKIIVGSPSGRVREI